MAALILCSSAARAERLPPELTAIAEKLPAIVIGTLHADGTTEIQGFSTSLTKPDGRTLFEIGSATKVFTALLLADAVTHQRVALDDPVSKLLPPAVKLPTRDGRAITLLDLATHTSGLPRMPGNFAPRDPTRPYVDYDAAHLYAYLASATLATTPGTQYEYSNLGAALLGHALSLLEKKPYATLVEERITRPLAMKDTRVALLPADRARVAVGHDAEGQVVPGWDFDVFAPAGALHSTADDLLLFLAAQLGHIPSQAASLAPAITLTHTPRHPLVNDVDKGDHIALGWHITDGGRSVWHNGQTGGFHSYLAFDPVKHVAIVVLAAQASGAVDAIGHTALRIAAGDPPPPSFAERPAITLPVAKLDALVGVYRLAPTFAIAIRREGDHLVEQATGQPAFPIFAASETLFFLRVVPAEIEFGTDQLVLHQNGHDLVGRREKPAR